MQIPRPRSSLVESRSPVLIIERLSAVGMRISMTGDLWRKLRSEAEEVVRKEPLLASYVYACVLNHKDLPSSLSFILANKLADNVMPAVTVRELFREAYSASPRIIDCAARDILAVYERDPRG